MTKKEFLRHLSAIYALGNRADHDDKPIEEAWAHPDMAGKLLCQHLDKAIHAMMEAGTIEMEEYWEFHDTLGDYK